MKIEDGKRYLNGRGDELGPMVLGKSTGVFFDQHGRPYGPDGQQWGHVPESTGNIVKKLAGTKASPLEHPKSER